MGAPQRLRCLLLVPFTTITRAQTRAVAVTSRDEEARYHCRCRLCSLSLLLLLLLLWLLLLLRLLLCGQERSAGLLMSVGRQVP